MRDLVRNLNRRLMQWGLYPRSGLARFTLWLVALYLISEIVSLLSPTGSGFRATLGTWAGIFEFVAVVCAIILLLRWTRQHLLWRLRNRLIVTYVFIGVIPVVLILTMFGLAGYLLANQLTTMIVHRDLNSVVRNLDTLNAAVSEEIAHHLPERGSAPLRIEATSTRGPLAVFPGASAAAWVNGAPVKLADVTAPPAELQDPKRDFSGLVSYEGGFVVRSFLSSKVPAGELDVVLVVPLSRELLSSTIGDLGEVMLFAMQENQAQSGDTNHIQLTFGDKRQQGVIPSPAVTAGEVPEKRYALDPDLSFRSAFPAFYWTANKQFITIVGISTRPSVLFQRLFNDLGDFGSALLIFLAVVAIAFGLIELIALIVGLRLTRTITGSVAQLYRATQYINRGDLHYRIPVRSNDQLASLETSFNSMSESLARLLQEQKEKQRLQNELAIAQEVQAQLFPRDLKTLPSLELHGFCKPARTVSGDYYDFIAFGEERLGIAVGDISGKGISAALLMATIHSAVRVFELGAMEPREEMVAAGAAAIASGSTLRAPLWSNASEQLQSPAEVLMLLNRHLYQSTPAEKYATLFLGIYDSPSRTLTYSNGGHLPPFLIHDSGAVRKLETGGLVIGLFPEITLDEEQVPVVPGDIFVAFSDGVTEPENDFGEFGEDRLLELVRANRHLPLERISETVLAAVQDWIGDNEQPDDITLVLARVR
ncbi:MAG TPA: PP2C family protein-serine/threonine phosphatase [Terriglobales bacterium]|nr:PP2C family protein-serine/threonine phosphatase [Terriglobales bacterium]